MVVLASIYSGSAFYARHDFGRFERSPGPPIQTFASPKVSQNPNNSESYTQVSAPCRAHQQIRQPNEAASRLLPDGWLLSGNAGTRSRAAQHCDRSQIHVSADRQCAATCRAERLSLRLVRPQHQGVLSVFDGAGRSRLQVQLRRQAIVTETPGSLDREQAVRAG
jgi:hypothetical protein